MRLFASYQSVITLQRRARLGLFHASLKAIPHRGRRMDITSAGGVDRRTFLRAALVAGVAVVVRPLAATAQSASFDARMTASGSGWRRGAATAVRRIDGRPKV